MFIFERNCSLDYLSLDCIAALGQGGIQSKEMLDGLGEEGGVAYEPSPGKGKGNKLFSLPFPPTPA